MASPNPQTRSITIAGIGVIAVVGLIVYCTSLYDKAPGPPGQPVASRPASRPATRPASDQSESIPLPPEVKIAWTQGTPPDPARKAFQNALRPHLKARDNGVRMTWFIHGKPQVAMICDVNMDNGRVYTAREVYEWATQGAQWGTHLDEEGVRIVGGIARDLPPSEKAVDSRYSVLLSAPAANGRVLRIYDRRRLPDKIARLYEIVEAHIGYYPEEAAADKDIAPPAALPAAATSHQAGEDALLAQAREIRARRPGAPREMWQQLAALVQPGMSVGEMESVLGMPADGAFNQYLNRDRLTLIYRLSDRFRVRAVGRFGKPGGQGLESAILLDRPRIEDEHLVREENRPAPATRALLSGKKKKPATEVTELHGVKRSLYGCHAQVCAGMIARHSHARAPIRVSTDLGMAPNRDSSLFTSEISVLSVASCCRFGSARKSRHANLVKGRPT